MKNQDSFVCLSDWHDASYLDSSNFDEPILSNFCIRDYILYGQDVGNNIYGYINGKIYFCTNHRYKPIDVPIEKLCPEYQVDDIRFPYEETVVLTMAINEHIPYIQDTSKCKHIIYDY